MNICILTQPLAYNYGGLLQAFALQRAVTLLGHNVVTEDIQASKKTLIFTIKKIIKRYIFNKKDYVIAIDPHFTQPLVDFKKNYIKTTEPVNADNYKAFSKYNFDAYIIGSDQVWRPIYSYNIKHYFLDFVQSNKVKRIAYAASFGTDFWEFSNNDTKKCSNLAKKFDFISVREKSGVDLCKNYLGVEAKYVLDPTLLLCKEEYIRLFQNNILLTKPRTLVTYILDYSKEKKDLINLVSKKLSIKALELKKDAPQISKITNDQMFSVEEWLENIYNAEFIITDSFHGTVFSILFNKQFIVIGNQERGNTRIESILNLFGLEERFTKGNLSEINNIIQKEIDYTKVNILLEKKRIESLSYLKLYLQ